MRERERPNRRVYISYTNHNWSCSILRRLFFNLTVSLEYTLHNLFLNGFLLIAFFPLEISTSFFLASPSFLLLFLLLIREPPNSIQINLTNKEKKLTFTNQTESIAYSFSLVVFSFLRRFFIISCAFLLLRAYLSTSLSVFFHSHVVMRVCGLNKSMFPFPVPNAHFHF